MLEMHTNPSAPMPPVSPNGTEPSQVPAAKPPGYDCVAMFQDGLSKLTPQERAQLDVYIDADLANLLTKMFGEGMRPILEPFIQDEIGTDMVDNMSSGAGDVEAVPYMGTPIERVKSMGYGE